MFNWWKKIKLELKKELWVRVDQAPLIENGVYWTSNHSNGIVMNDKLLTHKNGDWYDSDGWFCDQSPTHFKDYKVDN